MAIADRSFFSRLFKNEYIYYVVERRNEAEIINRLQIIMAHDGGVLFLSFALHYTLYHVFNIQHNINREIPVKCVHLPVEKCWNIIYHKVLYKIYKFTKYYLLYTAIHLYDYLHYKKNFLCKIIDHIV